MSCLKVQLPKSSVSGVQFSKDIWTLNNWTFENWAPEYLNFLTSEFKFNCPEVQLSIKVIIRWVQKVFLKVVLVKPKTKSEVR